MLAPMYASFFRLQREPFSIAPDPRFLFMSEAHREALAHLLYGLSGGGGFVLLTGEIGAGKTTVCRCFLDQVPADTHVAYIFNPKLEVTELLQTVCDEFGIVLPARASTVKDYVDALNTFLLAAHAAGRNCVLVIDEAQSLSAPVLEQLRLLTNLETAERKLLQIVLIGQPELRQMLARPELEQLAQRVIARYHLPALSAAETASYVKHRLAVAGLAGEMPFDARALARIHQLCGGVPRRINLLADRALLGGYANGRSRIDRATVERAAREVFDRRQPGHPRRPLVLALGGVAAVALAVGLAMAWAPGGAPRSSAASAAVGAARGAVHAASAASAAVAAAASAAASAAAPADPAAVASIALRSESAGWRELAALWQLELGDGDPCEQAQRRQLACFRGSSGLAQVRELDRPVLLTLRDGQDKPSYMLLTAIDDRTATLRAGGESREVSWWVLAGLWRGEFATLWRVPPGFREPAVDPPPQPLAAWVDGRVPGQREQPLKARITAFQVAHGLRPDGLAGPLTLMQINRASGVEEPHLNR